MHACQVESYKLVYMYTGTPGAHVGKERPTPKLIDAIVQ